VLGCARPTCFGVSEGGESGTDNSQFYKIADRYDGAFRVGDELPTARFRQQYSDRQIAVLSTFFRLDSELIMLYLQKCSGDYSSSSCAGLTQWVGGITPITDIQQP
jgi:hypothetical protein